MRIFMHFAYAFFCDAFCVIKHFERHHAGGTHNILPEKIEELSRLELERIAPLSEAARLSSLSEESLKRNHKEKIIQLGPRRLGMRVRHALMLDGLTND